MCICAAARASRAADAGGGCVRVYLFEPTVFSCPKLLPPASRTLEGTGEQGAGRQGVQAPLSAVADGLIPGRPARLRGCAHRGRLGSYSSPLSKKVSGFLQQRWWRKSGLGLRFRRAELGPGTLRMEV